MTLEERAAELYRDVCDCLSPYEPGLRDDPKPLLAAALREAAEATRERRAKLAADRADSLKGTDYGGCEQCGETCQEVAAAIRELKP